MICKNQAERNKTTAKIKNVWVKRTPEEIEELKKKIEEIKNLRNKK